MQSVIATSVHSDSDLIGEGDLKGVVRGSVASETLSVNEDSV
jgi:hypothetical protein